MIKQLRYQGPFIALTLAMICIQFDSFAVSLALTSIGKAWSLTNQNVQWVISIYLIGVGLAMFPAGIASDKYGHKKLLLTGAYGFAVSTFVCGLAKEFQILLWARAIQGVSAGIMVPSGIAYISQHYVNSRLKIAIAVGIGYIAMALGPSGGAYLVKLYSWRSVFWACLPAIFISILMGWISPRTEVIKPRIKINNLHFSLILTLCLGCLITLVLIDIPTVLKYLASSFILFGMVAFIYSKSKSDKQYRLFINMLKGIPLRFYEMLFLGVISNALLLTLIFSFPLILQKFYKWPIDKTGYAFIGVAVLIATGSLIAGKVSNTHERKVLLGALLVIIASYSTLLFSHTLSYVVFLTAYHILGFFLGVTNSLVLVASQSVISKSIAGFGSGLFKTIITVIGALGVVFSGYYINSKSISLEQVLQLHQYLFFLCSLAFLGWFVLECSYSLLIKKI